MHLACIRLSERSQKLKGHRTSPFVSKSACIYLSGPERAHLCGIVQEFPTFHLHLPKILCGGFVSQIIPPLFLCLSFHGPGLAFATRCPTRVREFTYRYVNRDRPTPLSSLTRKSEIRK